MQTISFILQTDNAVKFTPNKGKIIIGVDRANGRLKIVNDAPIISDIYLVEDDVIPRGGQGLMFCKKAIAEMEGNLMIEFPGSYWGVFLIKIE